MTNQLVFVGLATVSDGALVSRFPFAVGTADRRSWMLYASFGTGAVALGAALFLDSSRPSPSAREDSEERS